MKKDDGLLAYISTAKTIQLGQDLAKSLFSVAMLSAVSSISYGENFAVCQRFNKLRPFSRLELLLL